MAAKMHPEMQVLADAKRALNAATNLAESRAAFANYVAVTQKPYPDGMKVEDLELPGPDAGQLIPVRWYRPANAPSPSPVVLYFQGAVSPWVIWKALTPRPGGSLSKPGCTSSVSTTDWRLNIRFPPPRRMPMRCSSRWRMRGRRWGSMGVVSGPGATVPVGVCRRSCV